MRAKLAGQLALLFVLASISGSAREIAIVGATVIDGTGGDPILNATLVIGENGKIQQVASGQPAPTGAEVVNAQGKYIIPGLWDMHVHYHWWLPELFLHYGVTTIQSVGDSVDWILAQRDGVAKGKIVGPRIFACGDAIGGPKLWEEEGRMFFRYVESTEDARRLARELIAKGVDCLKVWSFLTSEQVKVVAEEAHRAGKPVVGHATDRRNAVAAAEAGVDQLAHIQGIAEASLKDTALAEKLEQGNREAVAAHDVLGGPRMEQKDPWLLMDPGKTQEVLQVLLKKGIFLEPDMATKTARSGGPSKKLIEDWFREDSLLYQDPNLRYIPDNFRIPSLEYLWGSMELTPEQRKDVEGVYHNQEKFLKDYVQAGGKVVTGTDTAGPVPPGLSIHRELELLVRAGLTPLQALQSGSYNCALFYKKEKELGSLQAGRYADLIILDADPLADIKNTRKISAVYKEGKPVDRAFHASFSNPIPEPYSMQDLVLGYPVPKLHRISPMAATQGDSSVEITLTGSGFIQKSIASFDGRSIPTKWISPTELKMMVPGELLTRAGTFSVIVSNPFPVLSSDPRHESSDPLYKDERSNVKYLVVRFR